MKILVQKFGGTSVSTPDRRKQVVEKILRAKLNGYSVVVVVSAMGRKGEPYSTDTLLSLVSEDFKASNNLAADLLMCCGEIISTVVISDELTRKGIDCVPLTGGQAGIITDDNYRNASVLKVNTDLLYNLLQEGKTPVVAGFQGRTNDNYFTTLGRGGSDVTAALLGAALKAVDVEIYTDVDGIMTADPNIVKSASLIKEIGYNEVFQLAEQGAKVIHPRAVEIAMNANITLTIKNTMSECDGTLISGHSYKNNENLITGITHIKNRVQIKISQNENNQNCNYNKILNILAENMISIDLINVFPYEQIFTIDEEDLALVKSIMSDLNIIYSVVENCSKIAIIGTGMKGIPGVMARILKTIYNEGIEVFQTADSHMTIWCLVHTNQAQVAINALHKEFKLDCISN